MKKIINRFIPVAEPSITKKEIEYVTKAVRSGWVSSLGEYITGFENKFAKFVGTKYALTTSSGTTALHLALTVLGIKKGDEVIIPDLTFIATASAVKYTGASPVFADIDPDTWCIHPASIKKCITRKTKAIIPVHLYGFPSDMIEINKIAEENGLFIIEDAAEAHGSAINNKLAGSFGNCGVFSFYGNKVITTGEGGMITTDDGNFYERAKYLRDHAMSKEKRYWHTELGYNYRITNIQAALGLAQLERIGSIIKKKMKIFSWYKQYLGESELYSLNPEKEEVKNVFWMVCLLLSKKAKIKRDTLMQKLREANVDSRPFFYPMSQLPIHKNSVANPVSYDIASRGINLPSGFNLSRTEVKYIAGVITELLQ